MPSFPQRYRNSRILFVNMQRERHAADYDPLEEFSRNSVAQFVGSARSTIAEFEQATRDDRRAFAVFVLFDLRRN